MSDDVISVVQRLEELALGLLAVAVHALLRCGLELIHAPQDQDGPTVVAHGSQRPQRDGAVDI